MPVLQSLEETQLAQVQGATAFGYSVGWVVRAIYETLRTPNGREGICASSSILL